MDRTPNKQFERAIQPTHHASCSVARLISKTIELLYTVKTVPTEIQLPKSAEIQSVYVAFHVHAQFQRPVPTETYSPVQSFSDIY